MRTLADANFTTRAMLKRKRGEPIRVVFVCHEPALWSMFDSVYRGMVEDPSFSPLVVAVPYSHRTLPEGQYKDAGMLEFCQARKIHVISGYDKEQDEWRDPASLMPDYVFFQTPYDFFPPAWSVASISMLARICYVPYGTTIFRGEVDDISHPQAFFRCVSMTFAESPLRCEMFARKFERYEWFDRKQLVTSGYPKLDYLVKGGIPSGGVWKRGVGRDIRRVLWTPRWRTSEGTCHFFEYKDYFVNFCKEHKNVDFAFRPHPLCLTNFLQTGELTESELRQMEHAYSSSSNMTLDKNPDYQDTFLTSDVLVSDVSSMLVEYFATGKPIVYTHRVDVFNELGHKLAEGFYWVRSASELDETLKMLISGKDPLRQKREQLMKSLLFLSEDGAAMRIMEVLRSDFADAMCPQCQLETEVDSDNRAL